MNNEPFSLSLPAILTFLGSVKKDRYLFGERFGCESYSLFSPSSCRLAVYHVIPWIFISTFREVNTGMGTNPLITMHCVECPRSCITSHMSRVLTQRCHPPPLNMQLLMVSLALFTYKIETHLKLTTSAFW